MGKSEQTTEETWKKLRNEFRDKYSPVLEHITSAGNPEQHSRHANLSVYFFVLEIYRAFISGNLYPQCVNNMGGGPSPINAAFAPNGYNIKGKLDTLEWQYTQDQDLRAAAACRVLKDEWVKNKAQNIDPLIQAMKAVEEQSKRETVKRSGETETTIEKIRKELEGQLKTGHASKKNDRKGRE